MYKTQQNDAGHQDEARETEVQPERTYIKPEIKCYGQLSVIIRGLSGPGIDDGTRSSKPRD